MCRYVHASHFIYVFDPCALSYIVSSGILKTGEGGFSYIDDDHDPIDCARSVMVSACGLVIY
jgi:hypothetical protein